MGLHIMGVKKNMEKQSYIESLGFTVLRFTDYEVQFRFNYILAKINEWIITNTSDLNTTH